MWLRSRSKFFRFTIVLLLLSLSSGCALFGVRRKPRMPQYVQAEEGRFYRGRWLLVETKKDTLTVYDEDSPVETFDNIAIGSGGAGIKRKRGDKVTPFGVFRVMAIRPSGNYGHFISLNYPTRAYAERGLGEKIIDKSMYQRIQRAVEEGRMPPQDSRLGGDIGIHGVGRANVHIHRALNWTRGCVALEDRQIKRLLELVRPNMVVDIR